MSDEVNSYSNVWFSAAIFGYNLTKYTFFFDNHTVLVLMKMITFDSLKCLKQFNWCCNVIKSLQKKELPTE